MEMEYTEMEDGEGGGVGVVSVCWDDWDREQTTQHNIVTVRVGIYAIHSPDYTVLHSAGDDVPIHTYANLRFQDLEFATLLLS